MPEPDEKLLKARAHMTVVAMGLVAAFGPDDAIASLAGVLVRVLLDMRGQESAVEYLRLLAAEVEQPSIPPPFPELN